MNSLEQNWYILQEENCILSQVVGISYFSFAGTRQSEWCPWLVDSIGRVVLFMEITYVYVILQDLLVMLHI